MVTEAVLAPNSASPPLAMVVMGNLIGDDILRVPEIARERNAALHLYGKSEARPGRKMGHVNRVQVPAAGK